jgi:hypothetical protein
MKQATVKRGRVKMNGVYYSKGGTITGEDNVIDELFMSGLVDNVRVIVETEAETGAVGSSGGDENSPVTGPSTDEASTGADALSTVEKSTAEDDTSDTREAEENDDLEAESIEGAQVILDPNDVVVDQPAKTETTKSAKKR